MNSEQPQNRPAIPANLPKVGEIYGHFKGGVYRVESLSYCDTWSEWMVNYRSLNVHNSFTLFSRTLRNWLCPPEDHMGNYTLGPRFTLLASDTMDAMECACQDDPSRVRLKEKL